MQVNVLKYIKICLFRIKAVHLRKLLRRATHPQQTQILPTIYYLLLR